MIFNRLTRSILAIARARPDNCRHIFKFSGRYFNFKLKIIQSFTKSNSTFNSSDTGIYHIVRPGNVTPERLVPEHIDKPIYYFDQYPPDLFTSGKPEIKLPSAINAMRESCKLAANILHRCGQILKVRPRNMNFIWSFSTITFSNNQCSFCSQD